MNKQSLKSELQEILKSNYDSKEQGFDGEEAYDIYFSHEEAVQAILDLLDKSLPADKVNNKGVGEVWNAEDYAVEWRAGYNQALADVRKVIKEVK